MPRGRRKNAYFKRTLLYYVYLLVIFGLIKIGSIPVFFIHVIFTSLQTLLMSSRTLVRDLKIQNPDLPAGKAGISRLRPPLAWLRLEMTIIRLLASLLASRRSGRWRSGPRHIPYGIWLAMTIVFFAYTIFLIQLSGILPSPTSLSEAIHPLTTEFYDRNGTLLYRLYEGRNRSLIKLSELPPYLIQATIAAEDKNFYKHFGIDPGAIARAIYHNLRNDSVQGASTITQQLVKNNLLTPEKTYQRKIKEILLSLWTERIYSKDEILQMYFNGAPYGGPAWGIEAASLTYFGKHANELNLAESAFLAGLPASPTEFSPYGINPQLAKLRQSQVLDRMVEEGYIEAQEAHEAKVLGLNINPPSSDIKAPHFVMYIKDLLSKKYGDRVISQGGLKIVTTLDLGLQEEVEQIVAEEVGKLVTLNVSNGAALITDAKTGQILAMIGSKDYFDEGFGNVNVTLSLRQPGSSIKVITYAAAFEQGYSPGNTILDTPVSFKDQGGKTYSPINYDGVFHGPVSIRTALGSSYNIPAVKLLATIGIEDMIKTARELGISTFNNPQNFGLSLTLGGGEVKMIDMISVYGTFSQNGEKNYPSGILKVTDSSGNLLEQYEPSPKRVLQPEIAYLVTSILSDNSARTPAFGVSSLLKIPGHQIAVKTGTSDNKRDNWTFGYTPEYVVGVWVGNNDNSPMNPALTSGITGAAPIWNKIMSYLLKGQETVSFERPKGIIEAFVDGRKDITISGISPKGLVKIQFATESASLLGVNN